MRSRYQTSKRDSNSFNCTSDQLFTVMEQTYSDDPAHKFIRAVNAAPEPAVVVATDKQLHDVVRFCTSPIDFSVLTIDPTFSFGDFDVTLTTFCHLLLESKRYKQPPVFIGPSSRKPFQRTYFSLQHLLGNVGSWNEFVCLELMVKKH